MNKRKFFKSLGALAVGCMMAGGLSWKPLNHVAKKAIINPEYANARFEIAFLLENGKRVDLPWPARSNNPHAMRDNDYIPPFIAVDA